MVQLFYDPGKTFDDNMINGPYLKKVAYNQTKSKPGYMFLGKPVHLPFGIASGAALATSTAVKAALDRGFDVVSFKTQRSVPFTVNPFPNVIPVDVDWPVSLEKGSKGLTMAKGWGDNPATYSVANSFGNASRGPRTWVPELEKAVKAKHPGQILIASVVGTIQPGFSEQDYWQDFADTAKLANIPGVDGIELNLSCPNVYGEGVVCYTHKADVEITRLSKQAIGNTPLITKFGYFSPKQQDLLEKIMADIHPYIDAVSAINSMPTAIRKKDGSPAFPGEGRLVSGLSGVAIKWAGLDMVKRLAELRARHGYKYEIIGIGGVMAPKDYQEYREAGADAVQSGAGAIWNPELAAEIKEYLK